MPYKIGAKGSYGCDGYPALKEGTNEVMGCHKTRSEAAAQIYAINRSEGNIGKAMVKEGKVLMAKVGSMSSGTCTCEVRVDKVCGTKIHGQVGCKG